MNTVWSCIITILVLCFIGVSLWLLIRKYASPNKKLKGGGIKMHGGDPVEELQGAINVLMEYYGGGRPSNIEEQEVLNKANIVFSKWISVVASSNEDIGDVVRTAVTLVEKTMESEKEEIIVPALSACMKSLYAFYIANIIKASPVIVEFYRARLETDYLARLFFMSADVLDESLILGDIQHGGEAIKQIIRNVNFIPEHVPDGDVDIMRAHYMPIFESIVANVAPIANRINTDPVSDNGIELRNLVSCLMHIYGMHIKDNEISERAMNAAFAVYNEVEPIAAWLCADEICDLGIFVLKPNMISVDVFTSLVTNYPGMVDFEHIAKQQNVSTDEYVAILREQIALLIISLGVDPGTIDPDTLNPIQIYEIASSLVDPNVEMLQG